ncbi:hypothetical protein [Xylocopilactobacillus apis]|uniref:Nucleoid-associated protein n=1 Tax=Xylocopilactobacillus apis TaxID=2932183 RepID=A0AAU9D4P0_9LACO|nr:hypothetical protein [Xylocopilactobacillus apis]BDR57446.1 hypothetical protein KIMC2_20080 [Xylocopilactobacillus apis]
MIVNVFSIGEVVTEENLDDIDKQNINKIFEKVFSKKSITHLKINCCANDTSILKDYTKDPNNFVMVDFAKKLAKAEQKKDGTRNKQILEGILLIQKENNRLTLLKLENLEIIDKEHHYEMRTTFTTESKYYKGCILEDDLSNIVIIDKNQSIAKYWREDFLDLSLNRNDYQNSKELIELLNCDELYAKEVSQLPNFQKIKDETEDYIFDHESFDKVELANHLRRDNLIEEIDLSKIYSYKFEQIDSDFRISKKALKENYKKTIEISPDTRVTTNNYKKLIREQGIEYKDGKLHLRISGEFVKKLPKELTNGN